MAKNTILYDGVLSPQTYLEIMTGKYFCLNADNQLELVERILDEQCGKGLYWSFALDDIDEVIKNGYKVVLVEIVNIVMKGDKAGQKTIYRWFEVPGEWTKAEFQKRLSKIE